MRAVNPHIYPNEARPQTKKAHEAAKYGKPKVLSFFPVLAYGRPPI